MPVICFTWIKHNDTESPLVNNVYNIISLSDLQFSVKHNPGLRRYFNVADEDEREDLKEIIL